MIYQELGKTHISVSRIGFGCWPLGGEVFIDTPSRRRLPVGYSGFDKEMIFESFKLGIKTGITFFDISDVYGNGLAERYLSEILDNSRSSFCIVTKGGTIFKETISYSRHKNEDVSKEYLKIALQGSLRRLKTDYVDVYLLHTYNSDVVRKESAIETLVEFKNNGLIRSFGVSIHSGQEEWAEELIVDKNIDVLEVPYNMLDQKAARKIFPLAMKYNVGIIARSVLCFGILADKIQEGHVFLGNDWRSHGFGHDIPYLISKAKTFNFLVREGQTLAQAAIRFVLRHPAISIAVIGIMNKTDVLEDLDALKGDLTSLEYKRIIELGEAMLS